MIPILQVRKLRPGEGEGLAWRSHSQEAVEQDTSPRSVTVEPTFLRWGVWALGRAGGSPVSLGPSRARLWVGVVRISGHIARSWDRGHRGWCRYPLPWLRAVRQPARGTEECAWGRPLTPHPARPGAEKWKLGCRVHLHLHLSPSGPPSSQAPWALRCLLTPPPSRSVFAWSQTDRWEGAKTALPGSREPLAGAS